MSPMLYRVGDWVFHNFELGQVTTINDQGQPIDVQHTHSHTGGTELAIAALTLRNLEISDTFKLASRRLVAAHVMTPSVHRHLVTWWLAVISGESPWRAADVDAYVPHHDD